MPRSRRPLDFMLKPPAEVATRIWQLPRGQRNRPPGLLHVTLLPLFDLAEAPAWALPFLLGAIMGFRADAFDVVFDRIREWRCVVLRGGRTLALDMRALQDRLARHLTDRDFPTFGGPRAPHVTINYHGDGQGGDRIEPIGWRADRLLLVESVVGETRHVEHGRWPLAEAAA